MVKPIETECFPGVGGEGNRELQFEGYAASVMKNEWVLAVYYTTVVPVVNNRIL